MAVLPSKDNELSHIDRFTNKGFHIGMQVKPHALVRAISKIQARADFYNERGLTHHLRAKKLSKTDEERKTSASRSTDFFSRGARLEGFANGLQKAAKKRGLLPGSN